MTDTKPTIMYWAVAIVALLWNLMGCWNYILQTNSEIVAQFPEIYRLVVENRPAWATAGFAVSVFGGAVGAILLLLRRKVATGVFVISLLGTIVVIYFTTRVMGFDVPTVSALIMAIALVCFAAMASRKGWTV